jgi:hypothetical protein
MPKTWKSSPDDAMSLAALRWMANTIENFAIELYATDRESFSEVEEVLRNTLKELKRTRRSFAVAQEENGCPDGWILCHGICVPSCEELALAAADQKGAGTQTKRKKAGGR